LLGKLWRTDLLESLARQTIVPQAVFREVAAGAASDAAMKVVLDWAAPRIQDDIWCHRLSQAVIWAQASPKYWHIASLGGGWM